MNFSDLGLSEVLIDALKMDKILVPTEVQTKVIPESLNGRDLIVQSETGTGKTLAYLLPLFEKLDASKKEMQAIIIAPTHELAIQIKNVVDQLSINTKIGMRCTPIIGKANIVRQIEKLKEKPHIIVGSAGRILELIRMRKITAHTVHHIVLDEADKLLDKNNIDVVLALIKTTLRDRQLTAYSATMPPFTIIKAKEIMKDPLVIKADSHVSVPNSIKHICIVTEQRDKIEALRKLIHIINPTKAIAFINTKNDIIVAYEKLTFHKIKTEYIHGINATNDRKSAMTDFRNGKINVLLASDLAARGLHIDDVTHIFNYTMPEKSEDYLHRVGRTGRNGNVGLAVSIITQEEMPLIKMYERELKIKIAVKKMYNGELVDIINNTANERKGV